MATLQHTYQHTLIPAAKKPSVLTRFFEWTKSQEQYRFGWSATMLAIHGCALTPITLFFVYLGGNDMTMWAFAIGAMAMALVTNLAALPTKITIPVFFLSVLIDLALITFSATHIAV